MAEPFIGTIFPWAPNFAPRGWAFCSGQLLAISQNTALFSLIGTTYGGDGRTTFALPDLRGRVGTGTAGSSGGVINLRQGAATGSEEVTINVMNVPNFSATINPGVVAASVPASTAAANQNTPTGHTFAKSNLGGDPVSSYGTGGTATQAVPATVSSGTATSAGSSTPFNNMQPSLVVNYIIALQGLFPSRS